MSEHSLTPLSKADIWVVCDGHPTLAALYPGEETDDARAGTAAHEAGASMLVGAVPAVGQVTTNGVCLDADMFDAARMYADDVLGVVNQYPALANCLRVEERVEAPSISPFFWGCCDARFYHAGLNTLYVWDFKYGHKVVDVVGNWQIIAYAAAILERLGINGHSDQQLKVVARIVQPRGYSADGPIREWSFTACDIRGQINQLRAASERILSGSQVCTSGPHCVDCSARFACKAANAAAMTLYEATNMGTTGMTVEQMATQYSIIQRASEALALLSKSYKTQLEGLARSGQKVPGYVLERGRGKLVWSQSDEETLALGNLLGADLSTHSPVTPTQARDRGLLAPELLESYSHYADGALALVPEAKNLTTARRIFNHG